MTSPRPPEQREPWAVQRAGARLGWYVHAPVYVLVNLLMFGLSRHAFGTRPWSLAPLLGWGIGLGLHGLSVFVLGQGRPLRERLVQRERERRQTQPSGTAHRGPP